MDYILAESRYRRRKYVEAIDICDTLLAKNAKDQHAQILKCQCLIKQNEFEELEFEEQGAADQLLNEFKEKPRKVGTSIGTSYNPIMHPTSQAGRMVSGYQRPGTSNQGSRAGGARRTQNILSRAAGNPMTSNGRVLRLGTAALISTGESFLNTQKLELKNIAKKKVVSRIIFKYLFYVDKNLKRALELAAYATELADFKDPWWKVAVGKCYYHMGLHAESKKQFQSAIKQNQNIESYLYLSQLQLKQKSPESAIATLEDAKNLYPDEVILHIHIARIYESLNEIEKSFQKFKQVILIQSCNVEAVASIAAYYFYKDQAEIAAKLYQRLIQLGFGTAEVWNNIGLCCFQSGKFDLFYSCFERALNTTSDQFVLSDIWYNMGNLYIQLGNTPLAEMCYKSSLTTNPSNWQSLNNLAVLHFKKDNLDSAILYSQRSYRASAEFDPAYNLSIWYFQKSDIKNAKFYNGEALKLYPGHYDSLKLQKKIQLLLN